MYIGIYMKFLELVSINPYLNLAIEEYLLEKAEEDTFILWQNEPSVVVGKNQNPYAEVKIDLCNERGIHIVRRITGGGAVYHDLGNVNYSFISSSRASGIDFDYFTRPIINSLYMLGVNCSLSGRNDLILENGKKISGNAQHSSHGRVLHHGTLLFDSDLTVLDEILNVDPEKLKSKAVRSARARVANIKDYCNKGLNISDFKRHIKSSIVEFFNAHEISSPQNGEIEMLYSRNCSAEWIFNPSKLLSSYNIIRKKRFDFGTVEINLTLSAGVITDSKILGDFFEKSSVSEFEELMKGKTVSEVISEDSIDISNFILGMSREDLRELLLS